MNEDIQTKIQHFIGKEILFGKAAGLDKDTPLLEWGVINSLEMHSLVAFIEREFRVVVPGDSIVAEHFASIAALSRLVQNLLQSSSAAPVAS